MKGSEMEIEDRLKDAAKWRPRDAMPPGLERRALVRNRPPLRPIGLARPAFAFSSVCAAAVCGLLVYRMGPVERPAPLASPDTTAEITTPTPAPSTITKPRERKVAPAAKVVASSAPLSRNRSHTHSAPAAPRPQRHRVSADDPIVVESRVAVEEPVYAPAYYAQPSEDGTSVEFHPVVTSLGDPDVIYTPEE